MVNMKITFLPGRLAPKAKTAFLADIGQTRSLWTRSAARSHFYSTIVWITPSIDARQSLCRLSCFSFGYLWHSECRCVCAHSIPPPTRSHANTCPNFLGSSAPLRLSDTARHMKNVTKATTWKKIAIYLASACDAPPFYPVDPRIMGHRRWSNTYRWQP